MIKYVLPLAFVAAAMSATAVPAMASPDGVRHVEDHAARGAARARRLRARRLRLRARRLRRLHREHANDDNGRRDNDRDDIGR